MTGMVARSRARRGADEGNRGGEGYSTATDLADWLTRTLKMPFRDAHHVTGRIVAEAAEAGVAARQAAARNHAGGRADRQITKAVFAVLSADKSVKSRTAYGGTAPSNVRREAKRWLKRLAKKP